VQGGQRQRQPTVRGQREIDEQRLRREPGHGTDGLGARMIPITCHHHRAQSRSILDHRQRGRRDVLVARRRHLVARRQVDPQLEAAHQPALLLRHLGVDDAAARVHPLHIARAQMAAVAHMVLVQHVPGEHVGDGLEPAVRMRRKTFDVLARLVAAELVEHQERVEARELALPEAAPERYAGAVGGALRRDGAEQAAGCICGVFHEAITHHPRDVRDRRDAAASAQDSRTDAA
jgi:hypothetical protein